MIPAPAGPPALSSPSNNDTSRTTGLTTSWGAVATASGYTVQVATNTSFATTAYEQVGPATAIAFSNLADSVTYDWQVNAANGGGASAWSGIWSFTVLLP